MSKKQKLKEAYSILVSLGMPRPQLNDRTALCLLALLDLPPNTPWREAKSPFLGITPIMDWVGTHYEMKYAPNTRETFRRQSMHQFEQAGIVLTNPDKPERPINSPKTVYQIESNLLGILRKFGNPAYDTSLSNYLNQRKTLVIQYANAREMQLVPIKLKDGQQIKLSAGEHSKLIKAIIEDFASRYIPNGELVYVGDTGDKFGYFDKELLRKIGLVLNTHGKMPDVVIYYREKNWLILVESVTSHGPVDAKRHQELAQLFKSCSAGLVYVSAFPTRKVFLKHLQFISWETEVWIADSPTHMIHFNGERFLGPYEEKIGK